MEKERKMLKEMSILVLILVGLSLVRMVVDVILNGFDWSQIEGLSLEASKVVIIVTWVCGLLFLLPEIFVGYKGIKVAKNPDDSKSHIVLAKIIFVCVILSLVNIILELTKSTNIAINIITIVDVVLDAVVFYLYIRYASKIRKQHQNKN